jgi:uncharacterized protein (TIGR02145 family)
MKNISLLGYIFILFSAINSCKEGEIPTVTTQEITLISDNSAKTGGFIKDQGSSHVIVRGVCWSTNPKPTIVDSKTQDGDGMGEFASQIIGLLPSTQYYVRAYATNSEGTAYGNQLSFSTLGHPAITTAEASSITYNSAVVGGNITADGGAVIAVRGICWNTIGNPTVSDSTVISGSGIGQFVCQLSELQFGINYYVRAFATSGLGTFYGNEISFRYDFPSCGKVTDIDGNVYNTVTIGTKCWMQENLKTTHYNNGDLIGTTNPTTLNLGDTGHPKYQWAYDGNEENVAKYGRLYTWHVATDARGLCPVGWHIASRNDWMTLETYFQNNGIPIGKSMASSTGWRYCDTINTIGNDQKLNNSSGFSAVPCGSRLSAGTFLYKGSITVWGCSYYYFGSTQDFHLDYNRGGLYDESCWTNNGFSYRCVQGITPSCNTLDASNISNSGATLNGLVNPNNTAIDVYFDYGPAVIKLTSTITARQSPISGTNVVSVNADISDLVPDSTYLFRVRIVSNSTTVLGDFFTFRTTSLLGR